MTYQKLVQSKVNQKKLRKGWNEFFSKYHDQVNVDLEFLEFDIGVLHESSINKFYPKIQESLTTYHNDHSSIHSGELISFFITDEINNKS